MFPHSKYQNNGNATKQTKFHQPIQIPTESRIKWQGTTVKTRWCLCFLGLWWFWMGNAKCGVFPFYSVCFG